MRRGEGRLLARSGLVALHMQRKWTMRPQAFARLDRRSNRRRRLVPLQVQTEDSARRLSNGLAARRVG
jgi:hypothetical protein